MSKMETQPMHKGGWGKIFLQKMVGDGSNTHNFTMSGVNIQLS